MRIQIVSNCTLSTHVFCRFGACRKDSEGWGLGVKAVKGYDVWAGIPAIGPDKLTLMMLGGAAGGPQRFPADAHDAGRCCRLAKTVSG